MTKFEANPPESRTFARQGELPKLPIPSLEETCARYLRALEGLQDPREHAETKRAVEEFLHHDGPRIQEKLKGTSRNTLLPSCNPMFYRYGSEVQREATLAASR